MWTLWWAYTSWVRRLLTTRSDAEHNVVLSKMRCIMRQGGISEVASQSTSHQTTSHQIDLRTFCHRRKRLPKQCQSVEISYNSSSLQEPVFSRLATPRLFRPLSLWVTIADWISLAGWHYLVGSWLDLCGCSGSCFQKQLTILVSLEPDGMMCSYGLALCTIILIVPCITA